MKPKTEAKPEKKTAAPSANGNSGASAKPQSKNVWSSGPVAVHRHNDHGIPDYRVEVLKSHTFEVTEKDGQLHYEVEGVDPNAPAPALCESKYLDKAKSIQLYRFMWLNRKMEQALENLFKQQKVIGGVYLGLGQEGCSCASALALGKDDWVAPMIRNQGAMLVRGFRPSDTMMQYMAKGGSPTGGRESGSHYGDYKEKNVVAPISHLGDSIPVCSGIALGARLQGKNIACLTYIGDGGQSTGPTYEGFNFAAVQKLGVILMMEHNLWAYSTPVELQFATKDLANRAIGYGVPGVIIDGTDPNQVYDLTHEAVQRAYKGEGATLIEAKMMRMRGHAMHDAAAYVPKPYFEYWKKRDPIVRMEKYLIDRGWLTPETNEKLKAEVQSVIDADRDFADASPFPDPSTVEERVFRGNDEPIPFKYGGPKVKEVAKGAKVAEASNVSHYK